MMGAKLIGVLGQSTLNFPRYQNNIFLLAAIGHRIEDVLGF
jgi:hypothetical protein